MINNITYQELLDLRENYQFEVKSAQGRNGNGEVPKDIMNRITYSIRLIILQHFKLSLQHLPIEPTTFERKLVRR